MYGNVGLKSNIDLHCEENEVGPDSRQGYSKNSLFIYDTSANTQVLDIFVNNTRYDNIGCRWHILNLGGSIDLVITSLMANYWVASGSG